ncbi:hypothetical protein JOD66_003618 [Nocardioides nitrophenolicus]|nr:hypothetical protein [Nocardioides nitrophenolicus]
MRGGFLIALDDGLFIRASSALVMLGGVEAVDGDGNRLVQVSDEGRLFTLYDRVSEGTEWEVHEGEFSAATGVELPDMRNVTACPFECRWPDLAIRLSDAVARTTEAPTWLLDGDGVVWDAETVDPTTVRL